MSYVRVHLCFSYIVSISISKNSTPTHALFTKKFIVQGLNILFLHNLLIKFLIHLNPNKSTLIRLILIYTKSTSLWILKMQNIGNLHVLSYQFVLFWPKLINTNKLFMMYCLSSKHTSPFALINH